MISGLANGAEEPPFERLEVIDEFLPLSGSLNMAMDEVLLKRLGDIPILRIYRWVSPTVSLGYFEPFAPVRAAYPHRRFVRRWTGGGVVEHGRDTTYSLLVPRVHPFAGLPVADTYRIIHQAVARALALVGWGTITLSIREAVAAQEASHACFVNPVRHDLMFDGRKVAGAAQRRTRYGLLHQGSIRGPAGMDGNDPADSLGTLFLSESLGAIQETRDPSAREKTAARDLEVAKYGTEAWLQRF